MGNANADAFPTLSASKPATSDSPSDLPSSSGLSSSGPSKPNPPTNLLDVDPDTSPHPDEPLPSYEDSTTLPASGTSTMPSSDPPPFSIYQPTTHPHYLNNHLVTHDPHLNTDGEALYQFLLQENLIPPIQHVQVRGSHQVRNTVWETDREGKSKAKTETRTVEDFRFRLDLTGGLWAVMQARGGAEGLSEGGVLKVLGDGEKIYRGGRMKSRWREKKGRLLGSIFDHDHDQEAALLPSATPTPIPDSQLSIRAWADRYCQLPTTLKEFIVRKPITNLSQPLIRNLITNQIRATNYRGAISISFPKQKHKIAIYPDTPLARLRNNPWVRWFFYLSFLWMVSWPILYFSTRKFHVVVSEWTWGWKREKRLVREVGDNGEARTVEKWVWLEEDSEREWVKWWAQAVRCAARGRRMDDGVLMELDREEAAGIERDLGGRAYIADIGEGGVLAGMVGGVVGGLLGERFSSGRSRVGSGAGVGAGTSISVRVGGGEGWGADEDW